MAAASACVRPIAATTTLNALTAGVGLGGDLGGQFEVRQAGG